MNVLVTIGGIYIIIYIITTTFIYKTNLGQIKKSKLHLLLFIMTILFGVIMIVRGVGFVDNYVFITIGGISFIIYSIINTFIYKTNLEQIKKSKLYLLSFIMNILFGVIMIITGMGFFDRYDDNDFFNIFLIFLSILLFNGGAYIQVKLENK